MVPPSDTVAGGDLTLDEQLNTPPPQIWFAATAAGMSCDAVCAANGAKVCDAAALSAGANSASALEDNVASYYTSSRPTLSGCSSSSPSISATNEKWMFFHSTSAFPNACPANALTTPSCGAVPTEDDFKRRRLCPCKTSRRRRLLRTEKNAVPCPHTLPENAATGIAGCPKFSDLARRLASAESEHAAPSNHHTNVATGTATTTTMNTMLLLTATAMSTLTESATPLLLATVFAFLPRVSAHNWIWSPTSRASQASTTKPCRAKRTNIPDVHINPGGTFEIEWATGHGENINSGAHYYTLVRAEDAKFLVLVDDKLVRDYLALAPNSSHYSVEPNSIWTKKHLSWNSSQPGARGGGTDNINHANEGKTLMSESDEDYIVRPESFVCRLGRHNLSPTSGPSSGCYPAGGEGSSLQQWRYPADATVTDIRTEYTSAKYPWIVQAHRFASTGHWPSQGDVARFKIPLDTPPGEYIMHWYWRGYSDCNDIAVLPADASMGTVVPVGGTEMYGELSTDYIYTRIDHCQVRIDLGKELKTLTTMHECTLLCS